MLIHAMPHARAAAAASGGVTAPSIQSGLSLVALASTLDLDLVNNDPDNPVALELAFTLGALEAVSADDDDDTPATPTFAVDSNSTRTIQLQRGAGAPSSGSVTETISATLPDGSVVTQTVEVYAIATLSGLLGDYGADHLYTFDESLTKYDDSAGSNTLQLLPSSTGYGTPTHDPTDGILPTTLGKMSFNSDALEQSVGVRLDRTTDFTVWMVLRPTNLQINTAITFGTPTTAELPFKLQYAGSPYGANRLGIMPRTLGQLWQYSTGKFAALSVNRAVALAVRYTASTDTISVRHAQPGVAAANKVISSWTTVSGNAKPTPGATVQLRFGAIGDGTYEWFSFAVFEDTALSDSQVDDLFSTIGF